MNRYLRQLALHVLFGLCLQTAQAAAPEDQPGYVNLERLQGIAGRQPSVEVTLTGPVLKMLLQLPAQFSDGDPEAAQAMELLKVIDQILVRVYPITDEQADDILAFINDTSRALEDDNWTRIVRVREEEDSSVDIHVKLSADGENLNGLAIMAVEHGRDADEGVDIHIDTEDDDRTPGDPGARTTDRNRAEVVFVNIVGNFNPAYLANIGDQFDIDYLDQIDEETVSGAKEP